MQNPFYSRCAVLLLFATVLFVCMPVWSAFPVASYFPLPDGANWNYIDDDSFPYSIWVVSGTYSINGADAKLLEDSDGNSYYFSNDANGIRMHRVGIPIYSSTATFVPPIPMANAMANIGDRLNSSGAVELRVPGAGTFPLNYTSIATIVTNERITVPAGAFDTIRHTLTYRMFGNIQGTPFDETDTSTVWFAPNIGIVKDSEPGYPTLHLVDTNVVIKLPTVSISFPAEGSIQTSNFELELSVSNWTVTPNGSHFHWFLDDIDQGPRYDLSPIPVSGLADGPHTIVVRLANADHTFTGVEDSVSFVFEKQSSGIITIINTLLLSD